MIEGPSHRLAGLNKNHISGTLVAFLPKIKRLIRYGIVGTAGMVLYFMTLAFLVEIMDLDPVLSSIVAFIFVTVFLYIFNRFWVFESTHGHSYSVPRFLVVSVLALFLNTGVMHLTINILGWAYLLGQLSATVIVPSTNFLLMYYWSFK